MSKLRESALLWVAVLLSVIVVLASSAPKLMQNTPPHPDDNDDDDDFAQAAPVQETPPEQPYTHPSYFPVKGAKKVVTCPRSLPEVLEREKKAIKCWCEDDRGVCHLWCPTPLNGIVGCIGADISMDFVTMQQSLDVKNRMSDQAEMYRFDTGPFMNMSCTPTRHWSPLKGTHYKHIAKFLRATNVATGQACEGGTISSPVPTIGTPTFFTIRNNFANAWHTTFNLMFAWMTLVVHNCGKTVGPTFNVVIMDAHDPSVVDEIWSEALGEYATLKNMSKRYPSGMCFHQSIFPLGLENIDTTVRSRDDWHTPEVFHLFREFMLQRANVEGSYLQARITISVIWRRDYHAHKRMNGRVKRKIKNEEQVRAMLHRIGEDMNVAVQHADLASMSIRDQIRFAARTDILVGVNGAGLTQMIYMRPGSHVVGIQAIKSSVFRELADISALSFATSNTSLEGKNPEWVTPNINALDAQLRSIVDKVKRNV